VDDAGGRLGQQSHDRQGGEGFSASGFADQRHRLAGAHREAQPVDGLHRAAAREQSGAQVAHIEGSGHHRSRSLGLRASLSPSPIRLRQSTVTMMATPGMAQMYQELRMSWRPSPISRPQLARFGSPSPRNDTADSNRMAPATTSEDSTITGGRALGRISPTMMRPLPMPMARQACTNSRPRKAKNSARGMPANEVQITKTKQNTRQQQ